MKNHFTLYLFVLGSFSMAGCGRMTNAEIKTVQWKYGEGYHIGDIVLLDDRNLKGDTIYNGDKPVALITHCGGMFWESPDLEIIDLATGKTGTYHELGKHD